jgi:hypothetical protein
VLLPSYAITQEISAEEITREQVIIDRLLILQGNKLAISEITSSGTLSNESPTWLRIINYNQKGSLTLTGTKHLTSVIFELKFTGKIQTITPSKPQTIFPLLCLINLQPDANFTRDN